MTDNFEEFTLDSLELEEESETGSLRGSRKSELWGVSHGRRGKENLIPSFEKRRCGDGAEMKVRNFLV